MLFGSLCSGIEAASVAFEPLGFKAKFFSEIDPFPSAVLSHRFPEVPNLGDMTLIHNSEVFKSGTDIDLLVGGTPCQSFSIAGLRKGLEDPRGNLALEFLRILKESRARWFIWENVPGVLSSNGGGDFGTFLGAISLLGYGFAYRVLDAQYFGVPQRRRRVFVVGYSGDWRYPAEVLFKSESLSRYIEKVGKAGKEVTGTLSSRSSAGGGLGTDFECSGGLIPESRPASWPAKITSTINAHFGDKQGLEDQHALGGASLFVPATIGGLTTKAGTGLGAPEVDAGHYFPHGTGVRRLTPIECERLQGFPDNWTLIPYRGKSADKCPDGPRYKAIGNSMAVPNMRWLGSRIQSVDNRIKLAIP